MYLSLAIVYKKYVDNFAEKGWEGQAEKSKQIECEELKSRYRPIAVDFCLMPNNGIKNVSCVSNKTKTAWILSPTVNTM